MTVRIIKNQIIGVSFRRKGFHKKSYQKNQIDLADLDVLYLQLKSDYPIQLSPNQITDLLGEHGKNILNSLQSDCVDKIAKWTALLKLIQNNYNISNLKLDINNNDRFLNINPCFDSEIEITNRVDFFLKLNSEIEIYLEAKRLIQLWKHKLIILEMIANAQIYFLNKY